MTCFEWLEGETTNTLTELCVALALKKMEKGSESNESDGTKDVYLQKTSIIHASNLGFVFERKEVVCSQNQVERTFMWQLVEKHSKRSGSHERPVGFRVLALTDRVANHSLGDILLPTNSEGSGTSSPNVKRSRGQLFFPRERATQSSIHTYGYANTHTYRYMVFRFRQKK